MDVKNFDELLKFAKSKHTDIEKLRVLQSYFLENVEFFWPKQLATSVPDMEIKTTFSTDEEKVKELEKFQLLYGKNFCFSTELREKILQILGEKILPFKKTIKGYGFIKEQTITHPGYNGGIYDCMRRLASENPEYQQYVDDLIILGVCADFTPFAKKFCDNLGINCKKAHCSGHVFNLITIEGEERIFDI